MRYTLRNEVFIVTQNTLLATQAPPFNNAIYLVVLNQVYHPSHRLSHMLIYIL